MNDMNGEEYVLSMKEDLDRINLLKKIGDSIPRGYDQYTSHKTESYMELKTEAGKAFIFGLLNKPPVSVCDNFVVKGTNWDIHYHDEWELFVVYEGSIELSLHDKDGDVTETRVLDSCDDRSRFFWIDPKTPHSIKANEHCSFLAITVPSSPDFPKSGVGGTACQHKT